MKGLQIAGALLIFAALSVAAAEDPKLAAPALAGAGVTSHPDALLERLESAMEALDVTAYATALYDSATPASDGRNYAPFRYYYRGEPGKPGAEGRISTREEEIDRTRFLFTGESDAGPQRANAPSVTAMEFDLEKVGDWRPLPPDSSVAGDSCPAGAMRCVVKIKMHLKLKQAMPDSGKDVFDVANQAEFYALPVQAGDDTAPPAVEYRLWKWVRLPAE